jgi:hypothetical protein
MDMGLHGGKHLRPRSSWRVEGEIIAGTLALLRGTRLGYLYAHQATYRNVMPNYLIQWRRSAGLASRIAHFMIFGEYRAILMKIIHSMGYIALKRDWGEFTEFVRRWDMVYSACFIWLWDRVLPIYIKTPELKEQRFTQAIGEGEPEETIYAKQKD